MAFSLEKLFVDVFAPQNGDKITIMYDVPHGRIDDAPEWQDRRQMAEEWHQELIQFAPRYNIQINPIVTDEATGAHNRDLPELGRSAIHNYWHEDAAESQTDIRFTYQASPGCR